VREAGRGGRRGEAASFRTFQFLPQLCWGRGTMQSMVEGRAKRGRGQKPYSRAQERRGDRPKRNDGRWRFPKSCFGSSSDGTEPAIAGAVSIRQGYIRLISTAMRRSFASKSMAKRMSGEAGPLEMPDVTPGWQRTAFSPCEYPRLKCSETSKAWCAPSANTRGSACPSTVLRTVPLPETSSGRNEEGATAPAITSGTRRTPGVPGSVR
jgi:hypothetical protein